MFTFKKLAGKLIRISEPTATFISYVCVVAELRSCQVLGSLGKRLRNIRLPLALGRNYKEPKRV